MGKPINCRTCTRRLETTRISSVEGQDTEYRVWLLEFPVLACPDNHERWIIYQDFGLDLIDEVFYKGKAILTEQKGIIRRCDYCRRCHRSLEDVEEINKTVEIPIQLRQGHTFRLKICGPTVTCTTCSNISVRNRSRRTAEISEALAQALTAGSIKPW